MQREEVRSKTFASLNTMNEKHIGIESMKLNDKYILCDVKGYFSEEDKDSKLMKEAIFVFDWQLNPIKKFDLPDRKMVIMDYQIMAVQCTFASLTKTGSHCIRQI